MSMLDVVRKACLPADLEWQEAELRPRRLGAGHRDRWRVSRPRARLCGRAHRDALSRRRGVVLRLRRKGRPLRTRRGGCHRRRTRDRHVRRRRKRRRSLCSGRRSRRLSPQRQGATAHRVALSRRPRRHGEQARGLAQHDGRAGKLPPGLEPTHDDLRLNRVFGETTREDVPLVHLKNVLEALAAASDVSFEGAPVRTSGGARMTRATVVDDGAQASSSASNGTPASRPSWPWASFGSPECSAPLLRATSPASGLSGCRSPSAPRGPPSSRKSSRNSSARCSSTCRPTP